MGSATVPVAPVGVSPTESNGGIACSWVYPLRTTPRARPTIRFWVAQATGLYRPATRRAERGAHSNSIKTGLLKEAAAIFRSASRRPARAGRPCHPIAGPALRLLDSANAE
jgi:hypothetical protein